MLSVLTLDHAVLPYFARMQNTGVPIDRPGCLALAAEMETRFGEIVEELHDVLGYYLNPNSDDQVRDMLLERLPEHMADVKLTPGKQKSTNRKVVEAFRGLDPAVDLLIEGRQVTKIKTSFALPLGLETDPPPPAEPNRARSNWRITRVASGRASASVNDETGGASLLTLPSRTKLGKRVRSLVRIADEWRASIAHRSTGRRVLLGRDLSQIEFRVAAHLSQDKAMCEVFRRGLDMHKNTASKIFGKPIDQLDKATERDPAKSAGFLILYGGTAMGFADQMRTMGVGDLWPVDRCQELLDEWFRVYPGVERYIAVTRAKTAAKGYAEDMAGRRRWLPGAASKLDWVREEAFRQAVSLEVQGSAQAILKTGMAELWPLMAQHWRDGGPYLEPILQVHDELLFEIDASLVEWWMAVVDAALTTTTQLRVPITSSGGTALDWGSLEK
jgi:DNA polymerase-1